VTSFNNGDEKTVMSISRSTQTPQVLKSSASLAAAGLVMMLIWGWLLPWLSHQQMVKRRLDFLDAHGIDASAMYYTELDVMDRILDRLEERE
jgi:hypothetical protein